MNPWPCGALRCKWVVAKARGEPIPVFRLECNLLSHGGKFWLLPWCPFTVAMHLWKYKVHVDISQDDTPYKRPYIYSLEPFTF